MQPTTKHSLHHFFLFLIFPLDLPFSVFPDIPVLEQKHPKHLVENARRSQRSLLKTLLVEFDPTLLQITFTNVKPDINLPSSSKPTAKKVK